MCSAAVSVACPDRSPFSKVSDSTFAVAMAPSLDLRSYLGRRTGRAGADEDRLQ